MYSLLSQYLSLLSNLQFTIFVGRGAAALLLSSDYIKKREKQYACPSYMWIAWLAELVSIAQRALFSIGPAPKN